MLDALLVAMVAVAASALWLALVLPMLLGRSSRWVGAHERRLVALRAMAWSGVLALLVAVDLLPVPLSPRPIATALAAAAGAALLALQIGMRSIPLRQLRVLAVGLLRDPTREGTHAAMERVCRRAWMLGPSAQAIAWVVTAETLAAVGETRAASGALARVDRARCSGGLAVAHDGVSALIAALQNRRADARGKLASARVATLGMRALLDAVAVLLDATGEAPAQALAALDRWPHDPAAHRPARLIARAHAAAALDQEPAARRALHELRRLCPRGLAAARDVRGAASAIAADMLGEE